MEVVPSDCPNLASGLCLRSYGSGRTLRRFDQAPQPANQERREAADDAVPEERDRGEDKSIQNGGQAQHRSEDDTGTTGALAQDSQQEHPQDDSAQQALDLRKGVNQSSQVPRIKCRNRCENSPKTGSPPARLRIVPIGTIRSDKPFIDIHHRGGG